MEGILDLARDLEDKQVLDRHGREIGRVDRVILEMRGDGARVVAIEIGPAVLAARVSPRLGRWVAGLEKALGLDRNRPLTVPIREVIALEPHVRIDREFADTPAATVEHSIRRWLPRLPGAV